MHIATLRRWPLVIAVITILAAAAAWALMAAPAGASATFESELLSAETSVTAEAPAEQGAPYTPPATPKLTTVIAEKSAKQLTKTPGAPTVVTTTAKTAAASTTELSRARSILASYIRRYPILKGTTVSFGDAKGYQAVAYYYSGRIVISKSHTASLDRIIGHEIWHVVDWRDNGRIDWGERVPPKNASSYQ